MIRLQLEPTCSEYAFRYEVAGIDIVSDVPLAPIGHLLTSEAKALRLPTLRFRRPNPATASMIYQGPGQFANGFFV